MTKLTKIITAAALTGLVGFAALSPSFAAGPGGNGPSDRGPGMERGIGQGGPQGGLLHLVCNEDGAERLETGLTNMSEKVELTDDQAALFETFKTAALSAQADYLQNCIAPVAAQDGEGLDIVDRMQNRQVNMTAQIAAMETVLPSFEAFLDSLTDEQKADMRPDRGDRRGPGGPGERQGELNGNQPLPGSDAVITEQPAAAV